MSTSTPIHVAIIMDGNRRWARKHKLALLLGHRQAAYETIEPLVDRFIEREVLYVTLWAFSTENWQRSKEEVEGLLNLFRETLSKNFEKLHKKGVRLKTIGDIEKFPKDIYQKLINGVEQTKNNEKITVILGLNYGGRDEIIRAVNQHLLNRPLTTDNRPLNAEDIINALDTSGIPDPDLIIRTGGEKRLSGFLLWQSEYSELYFTDVLFPDFNPEELDHALADYASRKRRFGK